MQMIAADIVGPLPKSSSGNRCILVVSDYFTRWAEAYGIPAKTVASKLKRLDRIIIAMLATMTDEYIKKTGERYALPIMHLNTCPLAILLNVWAKSKNTIGLVLSDIGF